MFSAPESLVNTYWPQWIGFIPDLVLLSLVPLAIGFGFGLIYEICKKLNQSI